MSVVHNMKTKLFMCLILLCCVFTSVSLFAQAYEVRPYANYYWPGSNNEVGDFKNNQSLGVRGGFYVTSGFEIGGNYAWSNHFQPKHQYVIRIRRGFGIPSRCSEIQLV